MKKAEVEIGAFYSAKVSGRRTVVRIDREAAKTYGFNGWYATNVATKREVHVLSAQRLRRRVYPCTQAGCVRYGLRPGPCAVCVAKAVPTEKAWWR